MKDSRTKNTIRNIGSGLIYQIVSIILPFINRTVIIRVLGAEFTGLNSLFASILEVLSIANLGFNTAIVYSLYKPIAERDERKICELLSLYKKIYTLVGTVILVAGLIIMPFLPYLIKGTYPKTINIYIAYLLYLINSVISYYLFAYKEVLLIADQRKDISDNIRTIINIFRYVLQFGVLYFLHSYYMYLIIAIVGTVITNGMIQYSTLKKYPKYKTVYQMKGGLTNDIKKQIGGLAINRICDTCRNSFDSLIISSLLGLTATAIYGNYYYIYSAVYGILLIICNATSASIGNCIISENTHKNYENLLKFEFIFEWFSGWCTVCLVCLYQPFMCLWVGRGLLLSDKDMLLFCIYFYAINMNNIRNQYISGTGVWWNLKVSYLLEAIGNLILNIVLGSIWGITGVLLATIFTIIGFNFLWRTIVLFKNYFKNESIGKFLWEHCEYILVTIIVALVTQFICSKILIIDEIKSFIIKVIICLFVPNIIYLLIYIKTKKFKTAFEFVITAVEIVKRSKNGDTRNA